MSHDGDKVPPYYEIYRLSREREAEGHYVIHLEYGDPDIPTHRDIIEEMVRRALEGHTHYSNPMGLDPLREKIAGVMSSRLNADIGKENVVVTIGSKSAIYISLRAFLSSGDKVLLISPIWGLYHTLLREMGVSYVNYKTKADDEWSPRPDLIDISRENGVKMIMVNNPNNPTSKVWDKEVVDTVIEAARISDSVIISDEVYHDFSRKRFHSFLSSDYDNVMGLYSFSKSYAMTGFRLGYAISLNKSIIERFARLQQLYFTNVPVFIQYAGLKALEMPWVAEENVRILWQNTGYVEDRLRSMGLEYTEPEGAFYIFAQVPIEYGSSYKFCYELLTSENVCFAPGEGFGGYDRYVRISASLNIERLGSAMDRLERFLGNPRR